MRESTENEFATINKQAERIASTLEVTPAISQTAMAQQHWNNSTRAATVLCFSLLVICFAEEGLDLNSIIAEHRDGLPNWEIVDKEI